MHEGVGIEGHMDQSKKENSREMAKVRRWSSEGDLEYTYCKCSSFGGMSH